MPQDTQTISSFLKFSILSKYSKVVEIESMVYMCTFSLQAEEIWTMWSLTSKSALQNSLLNWPSEKVVS